MRLHFKIFSLLSELCRSLTLGAGVKEIDFIYLINYQGLFGEESLLYNL
jgi:hypothetical protein